MSPEIEATVIAAAVRALPQVAGPHRGRYGEIATYLPGHRIAGVRVRTAEITVGVVARYPATVAEVDSAVRAAVRAAVGPALPALHVWIGDVALPRPRATSWRAAALGPPRQPEPGTPQRDTRATTARTTT
ncbi:hypothetical protein V5P93_004153 [Actinokineospora auranticolor]|uniref:Uncharacterized protein n=1 Tax=Actinokineospora auranticolor TaxID=155976 RepID=A0A2S6GIS1_9PSEU|nr:hypothetical protein [Actinokineospora auranticolor]PPK65107.1 hypothetical protein CLV40_116150 [Actinokineospora auranticolor]